MEGIGAVVSLCLLVFLLWARWRPAQRFDPQPLTSGQLRVVTWNVGYFALSSDKNMRDLDQENVVSILRDCDANVVILQELATSTQANVIAEALNAGWQAYSVATGHGNQVLSVLTTLPVIAEEDVLCGGRHAKGLTLRLPSQETCYVLCPFQHEGLAIIKRLPKIS